MHSTLIKLAAAAASDKLRFAELINGRLAMVGFFAAISAEASSHVSLGQQLRDAPLAVVGFSVLITIASIIPMVRGSAIFDDGGGEGFRIGAFNVTNGACPCLLASHFVHIAVMCGQVVNASPCTL